ncbi:hypothetical protein EVAR_16906_1 [Eumeta japonica]|uniref:Mos1 transposase HTH domain-containing protein n=1 Tax=Eumeta variegata TaxID=151549 RepID=A0A4C1TVQ1_EUMVA|nr:hypothetical protein EVAR_16906_1 [Eumeta japonica]
MGEAVVISNVIAAQHPPGPPPAAPNAPPPGGQYSLPQMSARVTRNWFKRLQSGNFDVINNPRSGRPVTDKVNAVLKNVEQDRNISSYDIAEEKD